MAEALSTVLTRDLIVQFATTPAAVRALEALVDAVEALQAELELAKARITALEPP